MTTTTTSTVVEEERMVASSTAEQTAAPPLAPVEELTPSPPSRSALEEMRRKREQNIYLARRRFMVSGAGGTGDSAEAEVLPPDDKEKADGLVKHSRHLNAIGALGPAADMFSPETKERIRRFQNQGLINRLRSVRATDSCF